MTYLTSLRPAVRAVLGLLLVAAQAAAQSSDGGPADGMPRHMELACKVVPGEGGRLAAAVTSQNRVGLVGRHLLVQTDPASGTTRHTVRRVDVQKLRSGEAVLINLPLPVRSCAAAFRAGTVQ